MIDAERWMDAIAEKLSACFGGRLLFLGLQGSYARGEASEGSDIDAVVVLDGLSAADLRLYREIVRDMPHADSACGFVGSGETLARWPKSDLLQFEMETIAWHGSLEGILPTLSEADIREGVRLGAASLYHAACHTFVHAEGQARTEALKGFCKAAGFVVQSLHRLETGRYVKQKASLLAESSGTREKILSASLTRNPLTPREEDELFETLIGWCEDILKS